MVAIRATMRKQSFSTAASREEQNAEVDPVERRLRRCLMLHRVRHRRRGRGAKDRHCKAGMNQSVTNLGLCRADRVVLQREEPPVKIWVFYSWNLTDDLPKPLFVHSRSDALHRNLRVNELR